MVLMKMKRIRNLLLLLLILFTINTASTTFASDIYLEITKSGFQKVPIGIFNFVNSTDINHNKNEDPTYILKNDLRRSQVFDIKDLTKEGLTADLADYPGQTIIRTAGEKGINLLVWGSLYWRGKDLVLEGHLFETATWKMIMGKRYIGSTQVLRIMVHRLADELVFRYTGEKGVSQTKIVYLSEKGGVKEIRFMDYDGFNSRRVGIIDRGVIVSPKWSPDGKQLIYTSYRDGNPDIYVADLVVGRIKKVVSFSGLNISPSWSPSGDQIAFATTRNGNAEIYTSDKEVKKFKRLTFNQADDISPSWSPTGNDLAFTSDRGGNPQIYVMGADGTNVRRLTFEGDYNTSPAWSPKGDWIAYTCRKDGLLKICRIRPDGSDLTQLTFGGNDDEAPSWSPDGRHIVFTSNREKSRTVYMMNIDGSDIERLTFDEANNTSPSWSPN